LGYIKQPNIPKPHRRGNEYFLHNPLARIVQHSRPGKRVGFNNYLFCGFLLNRGFYFYGLAAFDNPASVLFLPSVKIRQFGRVGHLRVYQQNIAPTIMIKIRYHTQEITIPNRVVEFI
jgi:hypothetical protein